jgi:outer membrane cobalamin receptor
LDLGLIDGIGIIRGLGSSLYGTNAFFAIICIVAGSFMQSIPTDKKAWKLLSKK